QPRVPEVIEPTPASIALSCRINKGQIARPSRRLRSLLLLGEVKVLERNRDLLREADTDKATRGNGVAVTDKAHRFGGRHDLAAPGGAYRGQQMGRFDHAWASLKTSALQSVEGLLADTAQLVFDRIHRRTLVLAANGEPGPVTLHGCERRLPL